MSAILHMPKPGKKASTNGVTRQQILLAIDGLVLSFDMAKTLRNMTGY